jgi:hypothetical protein
MSELLKLLLNKSIATTMCIYITNEMQLIQCSLLLSVLYVSGGFSAHHREFIKLYVQPWVLSRFPAVYRWCGWVPTQILFYYVY